MRFICDSNVILNLFNRSTYASERNSLKRLTDILNDNELSFSNPQTIKNELYSTSINPYDYFSGNTESGDYNEEEIARYYFWSEMTDGSFTKNWDLDNHHTMPTRQLPEEDAIYITDFSDSKCDDLSQRSGVLVFNIRYLLKICDQLLHPGILYYEGGEKWDDVLSDYSSSFPKLICNNLCIVDDYCLDSGQFSTEWIKSLLEAINLKGLEKKFQIDFFINIEKTRYCYEEVLEDVSSYLDELGLDFNIKVHNIKLAHDRYIISNNWILHSGRGINISYEDETGYVLFYYRGFAQIRDKNKKIRELYTSWHKINCFIYSHTEYSGSTCLISVIRGSHSGSLFYAHNLKSSHRTTRLVICVAYRPY